MGGRRIVALCGFAGSGKDTVADFLVATEKFTRLSIAAVLKDVVSVIFGWDRDLLEGRTAESRVWRETADDHWARVLDMPGFTPRMAMQRVGTDALRNNFSEVIWLEAFLRKLEDTTGDVVVTDARFKNELTALVSRGADVWRVERSAPGWPVEEGVKAAKGEPGAMQRLCKLVVHSSEYEFLAFAPDVIIENVGTVEQLHASIAREVRKQD